MYDCIVIGAGLSGCVMAERMAQKGKKILIIEKKQHIGGTCYDYYDREGILIHKYGPHIFNTDSTDVWNYVNKFSEFRIYHHRVLGVIDGKTVPIPFNLESLNMLFPNELSNNLEKKLINKYGMNVKVPIMQLQEQEDDELKFLANYIYEKVFLHYTEKQWGMSPEEIGGAAMARIPFYISKDDRYFQKRYQGIPKLGYTKLIENMLDNENINVLLNTNYNDLIKFDVNSRKILFMSQEFTGEVVYTAAIDELFKYCNGELPYRTLQFAFETHNQEYVQSVGTVNYPNNYDFTRITEFKYLTGQKADRTTIVKEFPQAYSPHDTNMDPYYPIPKLENEEKYKKYLSLAKHFNNLHLVGRLANYKYFTMAETIENALTKAKQMS